MWQRSSYSSVISKYFKKLMHLFQIPAAEEIQCYCLPVSVELFRFALCPARDHVYVIYEIQNVAIRVCGLCCFSLVWIVNGWVLLSLLKCANFLMLPTPYCLVRNFAWRSFLNRRNQSCRYGLRRPYISSIYFSLACPPAYSWLALPTS